MPQQLPLVLYPRRAPRHDGPLQWHSTPMNYQQPPAVLPLDAPQLAAISPAAVHGWRERWLRFLFGDDAAALAASPRPPPAVRETGIERAGAVERVTVTYEVEPGVSTRAHLLRPAGISGRRPAVVIFHQTTVLTIDEAGAVEPEAELHMGAHLAQQGYVVLCPTCYIFGTGLSAMEPGGRARYHEEAVAMQRRHPQWLGMARMLWDAWRAVDVLAARPEVDPERLGCIGHSLGAKEALFAAAFDARLKATVASDGGIGLAFSNWEAPWYLGPAVRTPGFELENHQVLALAAPRAFLLVGGEFDNDRAWPFIASVMPLWRALGAPDSLGWFRHAAGHRWPPEAQAAGYAFLAEYLGPDSTARGNNPSG